jgi:peptidoglycan hydrolase-like protein with peptidoglycan-binding domain
LGAGMKCKLALFSLAAGFVAMSSMTTHAQTWSIEAPLGINQAYQDALIWTGHYDGLTDGALGARTAAAISAFQRDQGWTATGELLPDQKLRLFKTADEVRHRIDWTLVADRHTGVSVPMPRKLVSWKSETPSASRYVSADGAIEVLVKRFPATQSMRSVYEEISSSSAMTNLTMQVLRRDAMFISGENETRSHYYTARTEQGSIIGIGIITPRVGDDIYRRIVIAMSSAFHTGTPDYSAVVARILPPTRQPQVAGYEQRAPVTSPDAPQKQGSNLFEHATLVPVVQDLLNSAGIERYKILPPDSATDATVFWAYEGGGLSSLTAAKPRSGLNLDDISNAALNTASKACKGEFGSKKGPPRYERGSEVRDVSSICRARGEVVETEFNVMEMPNGVILRFSHTLISSVNAQPQPIQERQKRIESAAWTSVERLQSVK